MVENYRKQSVMLMLSLRNCNNKCNKRKQWLLIILIYKIYKIFIKQIKQINTNSAQNQFWNFSYLP